MQSTATSSSDAPAAAILTIQEPARARFLGWYTDHPSLDWLATAAFFVPVAILLTPLLPLDDLDESILFSAYAAIAAAVLAFVTVAFTPLAILVALTDTPGVRRLRKHDDVLRGQFLRGTLLLLLVAVALIILGILDAADQSRGVVQTLGTLAVGLAATKVIRLTVLFWAVLAADSTGRPAPRRR